MSEPYIRTFTGRRIPVHDPKPYLIVIEDIAHGLALQCRFNGQCREFYSVAQHSVYTCWKSREQKAALLHDASEAYLGDVIRPLKGEATQYLQLEQLWERVIAQALGLPFPHPPEIKEVDNRMLATEIRDLLPSNEPLPFEPYPFCIDSWSPSYAEGLFLATWELVQ